MGSNMFLLTRFSTHSSELLLLILKSMPDPPSLRNYLEAFPQYGDFYKADHQNTFAAMINTSAPYQI